MLLTSNDAPDLFKMCKLCMGLPVLNLTINYYILILTLFFICLALLAKFNVDKVSPKHLKYTAMTQFTHMFHKIIDQLRIIPDALHGGAGERNSTSTKGRSRWKSSSENYLLISEVRFRFRFRDTRTTFGGC